MRRILPFDYDLLFSLAALSLFTGCGGGVTGTSKNVINAFVAQERSLAQDERSIATRICYAYQSKNTNFRTQSYLGKTFSFAVSTKNCSNIKDNYAVEAVLKLSSSSLLSYEPLSGGKTFETSLQTNTSGFLSQLCTKIQTNQEITNTANISGVKAQIEFLKSDLDGFILRYFTFIPGQGYKISSAESFKVRTQFNLAGNQILGMDEFFSRQKICTDSNKFSEFTQVFSGLKN